MDRGGVGKFNALVALGVCLGAAASASAQDQQLGARTKAMGGSYTAFEDDPVLVWLNPAGIARQSDQMSIAYQTYTAYTVHEEPGATPADPTRFTVEPETVLAEPEVIPSYIGFVFQVGSPESPAALGICFARPYNLTYALGGLTGPAPETPVADSEVEESLARFRVAFAKDFRLRPAGEAGFFPHLSLGLGLDLGIERWKFSSPNGDRTGNSLGPGGGLGLLLGVYEDPASFTLSFGAAYQSAVTFDFAIDPAQLPAFDMPQQVNAGLTLYLHGSFPLRVTVDFQWIDWSETAQDPNFGGYKTFEDASNLSLGLEYKIEASDRVLLFPRVGYRRFEAPWDDRDDLPATGAFKLVLETDGERFDIFTYGLGVSWTTEANKIRTIDVAGDLGGDSWNVAVGYTHEF
jgi:hypothetical protein